MLPEQLSEINKFALKYWSSIPGVAVIFLLAKPLRLAVDLTQPRTQGLLCWRMDGRMDGWMDGWTDGRTDR